MKNDEARMTNDEFGYLESIQMNRHYFLVTLALCTSAILFAADGPTDSSPSDDTPAKALLRKSFLGQTPPEIVSEKAHWLGPPPYTKLEQLHGKVVWLQFNF